MALVMESATTKDISLAERFIRPPQATSVPVPQCIPARPLPND
jgi:hypothetical protein